MRIDFYDSSAFAKLFVREDGTEAMVERYRSASRRIVSRLAFLEVRAPIRRLQLSRKLSTARARLLRESVDAEQGRVEVISITESLLEAAQTIMDRRTVRTLDAIHLATAISLKLGDKLVFVTSDDRLERAAKEEGFVTVNPEKP